MDKTNKLGMRINKDLNNYVIVNHNNVKDNSKKKKNKMVPFIVLPKDLKGIPCIEKAERKGRKCKCKIGTNRWPYTWSECDDRYCPVHNPQEEASLQMSSRPGILEFERKTQPFDETINENVKGILNSLKDGAQKAKKSILKVFKPEQLPEEKAQEGKIFNVSTMSYRIPQNVERQTTRNNSLQPLEEQQEERNNRETNAQQLPTRQTSQSINQNRRVSISLKGVARQKLSRKAIRSAQKSTKRGAKGKKKKQKPKKTNKNKKQKPKKTNKKKKKKGKK
jgi:hypothetical protein